MALRAIPQLVGLAIVAAPVVALVAGQSPEIVVGAAAMAAIIVAKRLLTNHPSIPAGANAREVLFNRLIYDRDSRERDSWLQRGEDG